MSRTLLALASLVVAGLAMGCAWATFDASVLAALLFLDPCAAVAARRTWRRSIVSMDHAHATWARMWLAPRPWRVQQWLPVCTQPGAHRDVHRACVQQWTAWCTTARQTSTLLDGYAIA